MDNEEKDKIESLKDIKSLIQNKIEESLTLEYKKELDTRNSEIAKDISAFANTSGGVIIYGIEEKAGIPISINWIEGASIKERIENITLTSIQPRIKDVVINPIPNPDNPSGAIFVVNIPESPDAPHMADHRYYRRHNFQSIPMEDYEVKDAMFRKGLRKALESEIKHNLDMAEKNLKCLNSYRGQWAASPELAPILLIPFYTEAWRAIASSGILFILKNKDTLIEAYNIIQEINYLIDSLRYEKYSNRRVSTPVDPCTTTGVWIPGIIIDKTENVKNILQKIKLD